VNAQRPTDGIAVTAGLQGILLGEDLDSFLLAPPDGDTQPQGKTANVDSAVPRWEWLSQEYPKMSATTAVLKGRLHPIPPQVKAKLQEVRKGIWVICVDGHPLRALGGRVDGIQPDGDFAFEVATDCVHGQTQSLAGLLVLGPIVIMSGTFRVWSVGL
jgi:hypothetical protein